MKSKRKTCVARAVARKGTGKVTINKRPLATIAEKYARMLIEEPITLAGDAAKELDLRVTARGGGVMAQAVAARSAIAKAILAANKKDDALRKKFLDYDRLLLVDDVRRVEPKKPLGPKARAKKQRSKR